MTAAPRYIIGIDVGGTFTDLLAFDTATDKLLSAKVPSLPGSQWQGVLGALAELEIPFEAIRAFVHGTTIATNALLERKGARTALVTTKGFRDTIEIGKGRRLTGGLFDTTWQRAAPLVPRDRRFEIDERASADGTILAEVAPAQLESLATLLEQQGIEAVAIAFLNSYVNAANERAAAAILTARLEGVPITQSARLIPERGEFERSSTAVLNAYLSPVVRKYLRTLAGVLEERGIRAPVNIMGSNGGAMTLDVAAEQCVATFLSGPVGGVGGAIRVSEPAGIRDIITFDMGGTSTDVALVKDLMPRMSHDNQIDAYPLRYPQLDIHTIGAGGGSIVWIGPDQTLQIGPRSAGAVPGPACYGRGGVEPTISDANLLLGRLSPDRALAGGLKLDMTAARAAFSSLAEAAGTNGLSALANAAIAVAVAKMAGAAREVSVHRGFDPREFALVAFGGAGPMHGFLVAEELGMSRVVVPRFPGHLSALGQMVADVRRDFVKAWGGGLSAIAVADLRAEADMLRREGESQLVADGIATSRHRHAFALDMRYRGQSFTLPIVWRPTDPDFTALRQDFDAAHEETFGYADRTNEAEIVNIRLVSSGEVDKPALNFAPDADDAPTPCVRKVWFGGWVDTAIYDRADLPAGYVFSGPAIIEEAGGTSIVPPGWTVRVHDTGAMIGERPE
ncbi:MAG TPA: hydantoinase/oxoprolinase family protein [Hyphomicrobiaceae bacterium]|nr:hydantoinase/oxoprolinase family protein [Hyphomicrobiaceae bacterium]